MVGERHRFNGTKVQWFPLMHGNGCQQAFSCGTTIRALSLQPLGGWHSIAPNRSAVKCLTYEVGCTDPFPKYQRLALIVSSWCTLHIQMACHHSLVLICKGNNNRRLSMDKPQQVTFTWKPRLLPTLRQANSWQQLLSSLMLTTGSLETCFLMTPVGPISWICKSDHLAVQ